MRHLNAIVAAGFMLATATACGGSSDGASSSAPTRSASAPSASGTSVPAASGTAATTSASPASSAPAAPAVVSIKDFTFVAPASVPAGATVQVKNDDGEAHTVTADSGGAFDTKVGGNGTASFTAPTKPGRYPFHCTYHGNMHGVLVVT